MENKPLRWGILSAGAISHDWAVSFAAYLSPEEHVISAVAARNKDSATKFAKEHKIPIVHDSYEELVKDPNIDVIYIGSIHPMHLEHGKLCLDHGKHVLCEKPLCVNTRETKELLEYAQKKKLFLMEAIWTRFFPAYLKLKEELDKGTIGEVLQVKADFGVLFPEGNWRMSKEHAGGSVLDIGTYTSQLASLVFGGERPLKILASGHLNEEGVDESSSTTLIYSRGRTATLITHIRIVLPNDAYVVGTKGTIKLANPFWSPTKIETPSGEFEYPLPKTDKKINFWNTQGLAYQCDEVRRCIQNGLLESPVVSHEESVILAEIRESTRRQIGVKYPQDDE